jgi:ribose/xylose/arabinose/galactoside ABC-type transport system permease subunit
MTTAAEASTGSNGSEETHDERLAYRGIFQRVLVRPEIGAVIAAVGVWVFFWAVAEPFGRASGAASILDVAASPLGIMAVAVAMLMIGGEFDLSSGAATGALGIVTILLVRDVSGEMAGAGFSLWVALPLSLAIALALGWFNGTMVNRTSLPSFIVTLGSFFVLKGAKLGFSKLIVEQIQVGTLDDLADYAETTGASDKGYGFLNTLFAAEWDRRSHIWEARDNIYLLGTFLGLALVIIGVFELHHRRAERGIPAGYAGAGLGLVSVLFGINTLHSTDSVSGNWTGSLLILAGMTVGLIGLSAARYHPLSDRSLALPTGAVTSFGLGVVALAGSIIAAAMIDSQNSENISWLGLVTVQGGRAILFVSLAGAALVLFLIGVNRARRSSIAGGGLLLAVTALSVAGTAFFVRAESQTPKFRTQAFSFMLMAAAIMLVWAIASMLFERRSSTGHERTGLALVGSGFLLALVGLGARLLYVTQSELDAGITKTGYSVRILWFAGFTAVCTWVLTRTRFGSWTYAVGGNKQASRQVGVPANRTKVQLFMLVSFAAWLVGVLLAFRLNTIQASTGDGEEFEYIIAAVVGGTALTGGYGSTLGAAIGAFIMAMSVQGIPSARWNSDWRFLFIGTILLLAAIGNNYIRGKAEAAR